MLRMRRDNLDKIRKKLVGGIHKGENLTNKVSLLAWLLFLLLAIHYFFG